MSLTDEIKEALEKVPWNLMEHGYEIRSASTWLRYLLQENQRYKKALEWYAGEQYGEVFFTPPIPDIPILRDCGERARQALKKEGESE